MESRHENTSQSSSRDAGGSNTAAETAYHIKEAMRLFDELLGASVSNSQPLINISCTFDGRVRDYVHVLRHHLSEALENARRENSQLRRLRIDQETFRDLVSENLRFHQDYLLESRRSVNVLDTLRDFVKRNQELDIDRHALQKQVRHLQRENKRLQRELNGQSSHPQDHQQHQERIRQLPTEPSQLERIVVAQSTLSQPSNADLMARRSLPEYSTARKRPRTGIVGESLVGVAVKKQFGKKYFRGQVINFDAKSLLYRVVYEDDDREDFEIDGLAPLIDFESDFELPADMRARHEEILMQEMQQAEEEEALAAGVDHFRSDLFQSEPAGNIKSRDR